MNSGNTSSIFIIGIGNAGCQILSNFEKKVKGRRNKKNIKYPISNVEFQSYLELQYLQLVFTFYFNLYGFVTEKSYL